LQFFTWLRLVLHAGVFQHRHRAGGALDFIQNLWVILLWQVGLAMQKTKGSVV